MSFTEKAGKKVVLVGTYKAGQLERWPGYYNYPLNADDAVDAGAAKRVDEIWLFNGARDGRYFASEFVGTCTRDELVRDWGYPAKGAAHGEKYLLYRIQPAYATNDQPKSDKGGNFGRIARTGLMDGCKGNVLWTHLR